MYRKAKLSLHSKNMITLAEIIKNMYTHKKVLEAETKISRKKKKLCDFGLGKISQI